MLHIASKIGRASKSSGHLWVPLLLISAFFCAMPLQAAPAQRIVTLTPHLTELIYAIGAEARLVATVEFSDEPPAARDLPRIGNYQAIDLEALISLNPDLILAWHSGTPPALMQQLTRLGLRVEASEPRLLEDISAELRWLGQLTGHQQQAEAAASAFEARLAELRTRYQQATPLRVFYQIWDQPLMTINGQHFIHQALEVCAGENVFAHLGPLTPRLSREAVLLANPQVMLSGGMSETTTEWLTAWQDLPAIEAVAQQQLYFVPPSLVQRPTPRLLDGIEAICDQLALSRQHYGLHP